MTMHAISPRLYALLFLWLGAFVCALFPVGGYQLEFMAGFILLSMFWFYGVLSTEIKDGWILPPSPILVVAALFWLLVISSVLWSDIKPITITAIGIFSLLPMTFFGGIILRDDRFFKITALFAAGIFAILGVWACVQVFALNDYFWGQARHPLADPSSLGALLSIGLFAALGWGVFEPHRGRRFLAFSLAGILIAGIMATVARGPIIAFFPGFIIFCWLLWPWVKLRWRAWLGLSFVVVAVFTAMAMVPEKQLDLGTRLGDLVNPPAQTDISNHRFSLWGSTIEMIEQKPWLGHGMGTFFLYFPEYRGDGYPAMAYHAHNDPLEFWFEIGFLGPLFFYAFLMAAAIRTFRALSQKPVVMERVIIVSVFAALAATIVQSHVSFNFDNPSILLAMGFLLAVWFKKTAPFVDGVVTPATLPRTLPPIVGPLLVAVPLVLMGALFMGVIGGEYYASKARDQLFTHELERFTKSVNMASRISGDQNYRAYLLAVNVPLTLLEVHKSTNTKEDQKLLFDQAKGYLDRVLEINPRSEVAYYYLGQLHERVKDIDLSEGQKSAEDFYQTALDLNGLHLPSRLALYRLWQAQGRDPADILTMMKEGIDLFYTSPLAGPYYKTMATLYLEQGNYIKSREALQKFVAFQRRAAFSAERAATPLPQALMAEDPLGASP